MKKKTYEKPQFEAFEVEAADIIATSIQGGFDPYSPDNTTFNGGW